MDKTVWLERLRNGQALVEAALVEWHGAEAGAANATDTWSAQDTLAHITVWERRWVDWLEPLAEGQVLDARGPHHIRIYEDENRTNARFLADSRLREWDDVRVESRQTWNRLAQVTPLIPADDFGPSQRFAWLKGVPLWRRLFRTFYWHPEAHVIDLAVRMGRIDQAVEFARALARLAGYTELAPERGVGLYNLACLYARVGRPADALAELDPAFAFNPELIDWARNDHDLDPLRNESGFQMLLAQAWKSLDS